MLGQNPKLALYENFYYVIPAEIIHVIIERTLCVISPIETPPAQKQCTYPILFFVNIKGTCPGLKSLKNR